MALSIRAVDTDNGKGTAMKNTRTLLSVGVAATLAGALALMAGPAAASGNIAQLSGTLSVRKADGSVRILSQKSDIQDGDTLNTQRDSYAQIKFPDGGQVTMKPNTTIKIEKFAYQQDNPSNDSFLFGLVKGGMRAVTGLVGKRGNPDAYKMGTATATIGIRGTTYGADDCTDQAAANCKGLQEAVYVSVSDGEIIATNNAGTVSFLAGQFGAIESRDRLPRFLATDPGLQFTPPASFIQSISTGSTVNSKRDLQCQVR
jgi:hypothetical protein